MCWKAPSIAYIVLHLAQFILRFIVNVHCDYYDQPRSAQCPPIRPQCNNSQVYVCFSRSSFGVVQTCSHEALLKPLVMYASPHNFLCSLLDHLSSAPSSHPAASNTLLLCSSNSPFPALLTIPPNLTPFISPLPCPFSPSPSSL